MSADVPLRATDRHAVVEGRRLQYPVEIRDASMATAVFLGSASEARRRLPDGLRPLAALGRVPITIMLMSYRDGDLDAYEEVAVLVPVCDAAGGVGVFVLDLPVTEHFTRTAGQQLWGLPKWVASINVDWYDRNVLGSLAAAGRHVASFRVRRPRVRFPPRMSMSLSAYGLIEGAVVRVASRFTFRDLRVGWGGSAVVPTPGHPFADLLHDLHCTGRAWMVATSRHLGAELDEAAVV